MISTDEREAVVAYFDDIAPIPTLSKEHEQLLAKEVESATAEFRDRLCAIPWMARETVRIWNELRESGRTTGKLSESFGSGAPGPDDVREQVDRALTRLERLIKRRQRLLETSPRDDAAIERIDKRASKLLIEADLSLALLSRARSRLVALRADLQVLVDERAVLMSPRRAPRSEAGKTRRKAELRELAKRRQEFEKQLGAPSKQFLAQMDQLDLAWERLDRSKNEFVRRNLKLVIKLAKEFRNMGVAFRT